MFDNANYNAHVEQSRGLIFHLDHKRKVARLIHEYKHPSLGGSGAQGSFRVRRHYSSNVGVFAMIHPHLGFEQILDDGDAIIGTGNGGGPSKGALVSPLLFSCCGGSSLQTTVCKRRPTEVWI